MANFVMIAMGLSLVSGIFKPSLVSVDIGTFQVGGGIILHYPMEGMATFLIPDLGLSIGQAKVYWGKKVAFATGLELFRGELACAPSNYTAYFGTYELVTPEVGVSLFSGPVQEVKPDTCVFLFGSKKYMPRLDLTCGFSPFNMFSIGLSTFYYTLRVEARLFLTRSMQIVFENRNMWKPGDINMHNTLNLALSLTFGSDFPAGNKGGEPEQSKE